MPVLFVAFLVVPLVELYVIIQVGQAIGAGWTVLLLLADSVLGAMLMKSQGRAAWRAFNKAIAAGRVPAREVIDGGLVILGGALLLTPGFTTDLLGVLLLLPPTRAVVRRALVRRFAGRMAAGVASRVVPPRRPGSGGSGDVDSTAREVPPGALPGERGGAA